MPFTATANTADVSSEQDALDLVEPGDTIKIEEGDYWEDVRTMVCAALSNVYVLFFGTAERSKLGRVDVSEEFRRSIL